MSAAIARPPGPATVWWIREPTPMGPAAEISRTPGRQLRSFAGSAKNAKTSSGVRSMTIVRWALAMGVAPLDPRRPTGSGGLAPGRLAEQLLLGFLGQLGADPEAAERDDALDRQVGRLG